jgi:uncharacterized membrane protein
MNKYALAASALSAAIGLSIASASFAADAPKDAMAKPKTEKCYGINAAAKNDCANGAHSCAGQATTARDSKSFVLLPAGDCSKIAGGTTSAM